MRGATRSGPSAPTTRASPPRRWSSASCARRGLSRHEIGREAFVERVWEWRERYGSQIVEQYKRLGASCDYERERFTLDEGYVRAVYRVFVALYDKGLIYRDNYIVNWDPGRARRSPTSRSRTARSRTRSTRSTTRSRAPSGSSRSPPFAPRRCSPTPRSRSTPTTSATAIWSAGTASCRSSAGACRSSPTSHVDPEFGTGALKITPGHDPNDFEIGRAHELEEIVVIGEDGRMTRSGGGAVRRV